MGRQQLAQDAIAKLKRYAGARSRAHDPVVREVTLTDDEAAALLLTLYAGQGQIIDGAWVISHDEARRLKWELMTDAEKTSASNSWWV